jgi:hypothetical protein
MTLTKFSKLIVFRAEVREDIVSVFLKRDAIVQINIEVLFYVQVCHQISLLL